MASRQNIVRNDSQREIEKFVDTRLGLTRGMTEICPFQ